MLLKIDEADQSLNITENKANSIKDIFFSKYCLDLGPSWKFIPEYF